MGQEALQYHVTMFISREQEIAIRLLFKEKNWPCFMNILTDKSVRSITQRGLKNILPELRELNDKMKATVKSPKANSKKVVDIKHSDIGHKTAEEVEDNDNYDDNDIADEENDIFTQEDIEGDSSLYTNTCRGGQTKSLSGRSRSEKLVPEKERIFKSTKRRVKCPLCNLELASKSILKRHCLRRHPDEWFEYKCADCPSMFKTQEELWKHRDEVKHEHPKKTPKQYEKDKHTPEELRDMGHIQCNACGKFFHNDRMLRKHQYYAHRDMMPAPTCAVCDTQFKSRKELWKHKKDTNHNDCVSLLKHYQCDMCGKVLKGGYYSFIHHQKLACGKKPKELEELKVLPCDICGASFKTRHQIQCQKNAVHLKAPVVCDICGNVYKNQLALRVHKKRHDEKNRKYQCEECGRSFFNSSLLKQHIRIHTKEKPFKCPMCNYASACKENIGKHTLSVHKVKQVAIDLRKPEAAMLSSCSSDINANVQNCEKLQPFQNTSECDKHGMHPLNVERKDQGDSSLMLAAVVPSTRSYVELMNCDINSQSYTALDARQYQYTEI